VQKSEKKIVRVSEAAAYYLCPRLVYFNRKSTPQVCNAEVRASIFKSISYGLPYAISSHMPESGLQEAIQRSGSDAMAIYGEQFRDIIEATCKEAMERVPGILQGIECERHLLGDDTLMRLLSPAYAALSVYSERLRLSGIIDKVANIKDGLVPVIISTSMPPESGIYPSDRVRLAAYAMLIHERYGVDCHHGAVEYVSGWRIRLTDVRHEDRRRALYARNRVLEMDLGRMPEASRGKWCGRCRYYESCNVKASLLDKVFFKGH
jgi:CRISPR-associated exonuclease Cas4